MKVIVIVYSVGFSARIERRERIFFVHYHHLLIWSIIMMILCKNKNKNPLSLCAKNWSVFIFVFFSFHIPIVFKTLMHTLQSSINHRNSWVFCSLRYFYIVISVCENNNWIRFIAVFSKVTDVQRRSKLFWQHLIG